LVSRGEIWLVNLDPTLGSEMKKRSEIKKTRPCIVVSPAEMHDHLRTVIVAPMTTGGRAAPFRIGVTHAGKKGLILLDQMRAIDKVRLVKRWGRVPAKTLTLILATLQEVFAQ
jgi:mRNA interferase MazF